MTPLEIVGQQAVKYHCARAAWHKAQSIRVANRRAGASAEQIAADTTAIDRAWKLKDTERHKLHATVKHYLENTKGGAVVPLKAAA